MKYGKFIYINGLQVSFSEQPEKLKAIDYSIVKATAYQSISWWSGTTFI